MVKALLGGEAAAGRREGRARPPAQGDPGEAARLGGVRVRDPWRRRHGGRSAAHLDQRALQGADASGACHLLGHGGSPPAPRAEVLPVPRADEQPAAQAVHRGRAVRVPAALDALEALGRVGAGTALAGGGGLLYWQARKDYRAFDDKVFECSRGKPEAGCKEPDLASRRSRAQTLNTLSAGTRPGQRGAVTGTARCSSTGPRPIASMPTRLDRRQGLVVTPVLGGSSERCS